MTDIEYGFTEEGDLDAIRTLLADCGLPMDGVDALAGNGLAARSGGGIAGTVALEPCGRAALLRSLAVAKDYRGRSLGEGLIGRITDHARRLGIEKFYLLTTGAERYFAALGFQRIDRNDAPPEIRATSQFLSVCPVSAVCMAKDIEAEP